MNRFRDNSGFTLIELMIATALAAVVMAAVYMTYNSQQKTALAQKQLAMVQQNIRAGLFVMSKEIRMAGYDPSGSSSAGITAAGDGSNGNPLTFTMVADNDNVDNDGNGSTDETGELKTVNYQLYDAYGDGDWDIGRAQDLGGNTPLVENIDALNFVYLDQNSVPTAILGDIRSVQISVVARADRSDRGYTNNTAYFNLQGAQILGPQGDGFRRKVLNTEIKCRNLGL